MEGQGQDYGLEGQSISPAGPTHILPPGRLSRNSTTRASTDDFVFL